MTSGGTGPPEPQDGPHRDFEALIRAVHAELGGVSFRVLGNQTDAEDAVQSACVNVLRSWPRVAGFETAARQRAYLMTAVIHEALQILRRPYRRQEIFGVEAPDPSWTPDFPGEHGHAARERMRCVWQAISELPGGNRLAMTLFAAGYEYGEIAEMMDIEVSTVRSHMSLARTKLSRVLNDSGEEGLE